MEEKIYHAVSYVRPIFTDLLCPEDSDPSLSSKIASIQDYLEKYPEIVYKKSISDNSKNSQTASLYGIERLIPLFENHICDCLILYAVTEFSNYIKETRHCLLELLPSLSVRILSVREDYDSLASGDADNGYPLLKDLLDLAESNEYGRKRKNEALRKHGNRRNCVSHCPYGYLPGDGKNDPFTIDPEPAEIVRRIFREYISGRPLKQIADSLTRENVLTCNNKRKALNDQDTSPSTANYWSELGLKGIMINEFYTGDLILPGYRNTVYLNSHDMDIYNAAPEMAVRNHHPAIITREEFDTAQLMLNAEYCQSHHTLRRKDRPDPDPYRNLVFCASCGSKMLHDRRAKPDGKLPVVYHCAKTLHQDRKACSSKVVLFSDVDSAVHAALEKESALAVSLVSQFDTDGASVYREKEAGFRSEMDQRTEELRETTLELAELHVKYMAGQIPADQYYLQSETLEEASSEKSGELLKAMKKLRDFRTIYDPESNAWLQLYRNLPLDKPLTPADGKRLIERILISPDDGATTVILKNAKEKDLFQSMLAGKEA